MVVVSLRLCAAPAGSQLLQREHTPQHTLRHISNNLSLLVSAGWGEPNHGNKFMAQTCKHRPSHQHLWQHMSVQTKQASKRSRVCVKSYYDQTGAGGPESRGISDSPLSVIGEGSMYKLWSITHWASGTNRQSLNSDLNLPAVLPDNLFSASPPLFSSLCSKFIHGRRSHSGLSPFPSAWPFAKPQFNPEKLRRVIADGGKPPKNTMRKRMVMMQQCGKNK